MKKTLLIIVISLTSLTGFGQKFEGLALTPPMGWNSWNTFELELNEQLVKETADLFVSLGLKDAGYEYIVLDDGWMAMERDAQGNFVPHPEKFPNGIKAVADYVHSKGLKIGVYSCAGNKTCGGFPGSRGHEYQDALKFAEWGIDYLKYDWCYTDRMNPEESYLTMRDALYAAGRPVLFSICEWGKNYPWKWAPAVGHIWRTTGDISNCFDCVTGKALEVIWGWGWGAIYLPDMHDADTLRRVAGPGHWNDMDMLEVGNSGFDLYENQSHFSLWVFLHSPLMMGNDIRKMTPETLAILTNADMIALSKDAAAIPAFRYQKIDSVDVWAKPLANGDWAFCFLNRSSAPVELLFDWSAHRITDALSQKEIAFSKEKVYKIKDLYAGKDIGTTARPLKKQLVKHQSLTVRVSPSGKK
jgi:alpha-galactosidase